MDCGKWVEKVGEEKNVCKPENSTEIQGKGAEGLSCGENENK